jgi:cytochrome P450
MWQAIWAQAKFIRDPLWMIEYIRSRFGNLFQFEFGKRRIVFALGPDYNRILHTDTERFLGRGVVLAGPPDSAQRRLMTSLFALNGDAHQRMRRQLLPSFQKSALAGYAAELTDEIDGILDQWRPGQVVDMTRQTRRLSWGIARRVLFGLPDTPEVDRLRTDLEEWFARNARPLTQLIRVNSPLMPYGRLLRRAEAAERQAIAIIRMKREMGIGGDALSILMQTCNERGEPATETELVGHVITLFLASYETTANTLAWTLFLLAQHPEIAENLCDEVATLRADVPSPTELERLPLMGRVLKESMRILPVVPVSRRLSSSDGELGGYHLPADSMVVFSHYVTHHMPDIYAEPHRFLPQRWETINPSPAEYMPFGAGPRTCIGAAFANYTLKLMLARMLPRYHFSMVPKSRVDRRIKVTLSPKHGLPMRIRGRDEPFERVEIRGNIHEMVDLTPVQRLRNITRAAA